MVVDIWQRGLRHREPFQELEEMEGEMERLLWGNRPFRSVWLRRPRDGMAWTPAMDVYEKEDAFIVRAELPGVMMENVDISMSGDTLTIKGERKAPADVKEEEYQRCEVCYGNFSRSIALPEGVQQDGIEATLDNGVLEVRLPKIPEAKPTKIEIKARKV